MMISPNATIGSEDNNHDMTTVSIQIKHSGKTYQVDVDTEEKGEVFKHQLYSLTGVPPERQKILIKGGQLKDDTIMSSLNLKPNQTVMMLGTAGELPKEPAQKMQFVEDMNQEQIAKKQVVPNGLINMGNTCYLNSTLQALRTVPELKDELSRYNGGGGISSLDLTASLRDLYKDMNRTTEAFPPLAFLNALRQSFPQFQERGDDGQFKQQDAEEAWSGILQSLRNNLGPFVDSYFGGKFETELKCDETDEPAQTGVEEFSKLNCHINKDTNFLRDGLLEGLEEKIEKHNESLGRNAQYTLKKRVSRLPKYLTVHFIRFFWKRDVGKKSKILRKVQFPFNYDATELCTTDLQNKLVPAREKYRDVEREVLELKRAAKRAKYHELDGELSKDVSKEGELSEEKKADLDKQLAEAVHADLKSEPSCNSTGLYQLHAIVTHKGPDADSGHYQCFVRNEQSENKWWKFNDDKITEVEDDKVEMLAGGGESDSALILLYKAVSV
jgi:ubiquitin carboxyl-terminal hydrolase 14